MDWFSQLFTGHGVAQSIMALSLAVIAGIALGRVKIFGISLGVGGVLFSGIVLSGAGLGLEPEILDFVRDFGLILFVFAVGMQVGPSFVNSLRHRGLALNAAATLVVAGGTGVAVLVYFLFDLPPTVAVGLFSGAVTNTPSLAAAAQLFTEIAPLTADQAVSDAGTAYALAYPFGICGIILVMLILRIALRIRISDELRSLEELLKKLHPPLQSATYIVENPSIFSMKLGDFLEKYGKKVTFSRVQEPDEQALAHIVEPETIIRQGMLISCVGRQEDLDWMLALIGRYSDKDLRKAPGMLETRSLLVTRDAVAGKSARSLGLTPEASGVTVTRITRAGVEFTNRPGLNFHSGDKLTCVGESKALDRVAAILGNSAKELEHPHLLPLFLGITLGIIVGSIPLALPGAPSGIKLGLAGGVLVVAIFLGHMNHFGGMVWHMSMGANLIVREIGISLFLACVGLNAGERFMSALADGSGFTWMAAGAMITFFPACAAAFFMRLYFRYDYATICGFVSGCMTNPAALMFSVQSLDSDAPSSVYASVYPLAMILRIVCAQFLVLGLHYLSGTS